MPCHFCHIWSCPSRIGLEAELSSQSQQNFVQVLNGRPVIRNIWVSGCPINSKKSEALCSSTSTGKGGIRLPSRDPISTALGLAKAAVFGHISGSRSGIKKSGVCMELEAAVGRPSRPPYKRDRPHSRTRRGALRAGAPPRRTHGSRVRSRVQMQCDPTSAETRRRKRSRHKSSYFTRSLKQLALGLFLVRSGRNFLFIQSTYLKKVILFYEVLEK